MSTAVFVQGLASMSGGYALLGRIVVISGELAVLALTVWIVIRFLPVRAPRVRALLWLLVLVKPILGFGVGTLLPLVEFSPPAVVESALLGTPGSFDPNALSARRLEESRALAAMEEMDGHFASGERSVGSGSGAVAMSRGPAEEASRPFPPGRLAAVLWGIGVAGLGGLALFDRFRIRSLLRASSNAEPDLARRFRGLAGEVGLKRTPRLRITDRLESPALVGVFRPVVLLPESLAEESETRQLEWLLRHELMHRKHLDPAGLAVRRLAEVLFFFHPAVWWAGKKWEEAMELACDRALLETETDAHAYAKELYRVLENQHHSRRVPVAAGLFATRTQIGRRIEALLSDPLRSRAGLTTLSMVGLVLAALAVFTVGIGFSRDADDSGPESPDSVIVAQAGETGRQAVIIVPPEERPEPVEVEDEMTPEEREKLEKTIEQVRTDLRRLHVAGEAYYVDHGDYPEDFQQLTTPIAYISRVPMDPFAVFGPRDAGVGEAAEEEQSAQPYKVKFAPDYREIRMYSIGPDRVDQGGAVNYDPAKGPKGVGDIVRVIELPQGYRHYQFEDPALDEKVRGQSTRLETIKTAMEAWFIQHRDVPESVEAIAGIVPHLDYVRAVDDLFADSFAPGRPVSYHVDREKGVLTIWSVGPDGDDDGGEKEVRGRFARGQTADGDLVVELDLKGLQDRFPESSDADVLLKNRPEKRQLYDMLLEIKEEEGRDNAMLHYILADALMPDPPTERQKVIIRDVLDNGWSEGADQLLPYLATFQPMFREIRKGVEVDYARNIGPECGLGFSAPVPNYLAIQVSAKMLCVEGRYFESQGKYQDALDDYLAVMTMGRDQAAPNAFLIGHLISLAVQGIGLNTVYNSVESGVFDREQLAEALEHLKHIEVTQAPIVEGFRAEADSLRAQLESWQTMPAVEVLEEFADARIDAIEIFGGTDEATIRATSKKLLAQHEELWSMVLTYLAEPYWLRDAARFEKETEAWREKANPIFSLAVPDYRAAAVRYEIERANLFLTELAIAIELYRVDHGAEPDALQQLVPEYLDPLPVDPFTGKGFRYEKTGETYRLWSLGPDGRDDHDQAQAEGALIYDPSNGTLSEGDIFFRSL